MQDIPYDIWLHITSFLPSDDVKKLLSVNYELFNIAMDERYRTVMFGSLFHPKTIRTLNRVVDPKVASHVRVFNFMPGHLLRLLEESEDAETAKDRCAGSEEGTLSNTEPKMQPLETQPRIYANPANRTKTLGKTFRRHTFSTPRLDERAKHGNDTNSRVMMPIKTPSVPPDVALKSLEFLISRMNSLITLQVEIRGEEHLYNWNTKLRIFDLGWSTFGSSLRKLELRIPLEDMTQVLPDPNKFKLANLESVFLRIIRASFAASEESIIRETMIPFLIAHRQTLRSLTLDIAEQTDVSSLLFTLVLPSLTHLKLKMYTAAPDSRRFTVLGSFFKAHRAHLTHFAIEIIPLVFIHPVAPQPFFSQDHFTKSQPRLQHLSIHMPNHIGSLLPYILQFTKTLVSLEVHKNHRWSLEDARSLIEGFVSSRLRNLNISVFELSPALIIMLAVNLPNLEVLTLDFDQVLPDINDPHNDGEMTQFTDIVNELCFPQWRLHTLNISPLHVVHSLRVSYKAALANALPSVTCFSGLSRKEYLSSPAFL